jgi:hypothetical protein
MTADTNQAPKDIIGFLDFYLVQKAPFQIPANAKEWIVQYGPWITVVLLVLALPPLLFVLGIGSAFVPFGGVGYAVGFTYLTIVLIAQLGLMVAALPGLFARKMSGWKLLFYAQILSFLFSLLSGSLIGAIVGVVISMYLLFQVRPLYTA